MKPRPQSRNDFELFQAHFDQISNREHALVQLADKIDWSSFDTAFADSYSQDMGAPAKAVRLMVGLQYLKFTFNESVVGRVRGSGVDHHRRWSSIYPMLDGMKDRLRFCRLRPERICVVLP